MKYSIKYVGILLVTLLCYQCETTVEPAEIQSSFRIIHYDALPTAIQLEVTATENSLKSAYAYKNDTPFGALVAEQVHQRITPDGKRSYTMALSKNSDDFYYDNLVINEDAEGTLKTRIIRYQPDPTWYYKHKTEGLGYADYSGDISIFNSVGEQLSSVHFIAGQPQKTTAETTALRANGECEIVDIQEAGLLQDGVFYVYEITITVDCSGTGTGTGGSDGLNDGFGNEGGEEGGGGGSPGGGGGNGGPGEPIETVPVESDCHTIICTEDDSIENNITDPCGHTIFEDLVAGQLQDNSISPEVQIPVEGINLTFSDVILDLFETSNTYDYIVVNGNLIGSTANTDPTPDYNSETDRYEITTTFSNTYLSQATTLSVARTMIHEVIHAYLVYQQRANPFGSTYQSLIAHANENGYTTPNQIHHEFMGQYVNAMAYSLYQWDSNYGGGGNLGWNYYYSMAFGGLYSYGENGIRVDTDAFIALIPDETQRNAIINIILNEQDGTNEAQGIPCN